MAGMTSGLGADSRFLALRTAGSPHAGPAHLGTGTCAGGTTGQGAQRTVPAGQLGAGGAVSLFSTRLYCVPPPYKECVLLSN